MPEIIINLNVCIKRWNFKMGRIALVTGGTKGIGAASAIALKKHGYKVVTTYLNDHDGAQQFMKETGIYSYCCDVSNYDMCQQTLLKILKDVGAVEILVNNAGMVDDAFFHKMNYEQWSHVININLTSIYNFTHQVIQGMRTQEFGRVINISSINGQKGQLGQTNYAAAKAGLIGFTKALALENASKNITVNAIAPGYIDTNMLGGIADDTLTAIKQSIPVKRLGTPEEVAHAVVYLASDLAGFMTGSTLTVNGGQYLI